MRTQENKEKYKEYDHKYYIKYKRPKTKIGQAEAKIDQLKQQLDEKDKEIEMLKHTLNLYNLRHKGSVLPNVNQLAIQELENAKMMTEWKFRSIVEVVDYLNNRTKELKGE